MRSWVQLFLPGRTLSAKRSFASGSSSGLSRLPDGWPEVWTPFPRVSSGTRVSRPLGLTGAALVPRETDLVEAVVEGVVAVLPGELKLAAVLMMIGALLTRLDGLEVAGARAGLRSAAAFETVSVVELLLIIFSVSTTIGPCLTWLV